MSDEEMQFADPEWQPPKQRGGSAEQEPYIPQPVNAPRDEQPTHQNLPPQEHSSDYYGGYRAQQQRSYTIPPGRQQGRRSSPWIWIILAFVLLSLLGGGPFISDGGFFFEGFLLRNIFFLLVFLGIIAAVVASLRNSGRAIFKNTSSIETRTFSVGMHPTIIVKDDIGTIRVHSGGQSSMVSVQATRQSKGWMSNYNNLQVHYEQRSENNTLTVRSSMHGWSILGKNTVDFDITVPLSSDLELKTDFGKIYVNDVMGKMSLVSNAGAIHAAQVSLQGQSKLKTDVGSVNFSGSIEQRGTYKFESDVGSINVTLPGDASFHVDAKTDVGSIHTDFPVGGQSMRNKLSGDVGNPPYAVLNLKTDVGSVNLKKR